jgi:Restriction endonuclease
MTGPTEDPLRTLYDNLTPGEFEKLLYVLLDSMGFENVQLVARPRDGGIDLTATYSPEIPGLQQVGLDSLIQAKRFGPDTTINPIHVRAPVGKIRRADGPPDHDSEGDAEDEEGGAGGQGPGRS